MQGPLSSDSALAVFPGQGTLGQNRGRAGGGEKQRDWGRAAQVVALVPGVGRPRETGSRPPLACGPGLPSRS